MADYEDESLKGDTKAGAGREQAYEEKYADDPYSQYLNEKQRNRLAKLEGPTFWHPNARAGKAQKLRDKWLKDQAPDWQWRNEQQAGEMALQMGQDINDLRADIAAGETGLSDAELRQMQEGTQASAGQQQAAQEERVRQEALAAGQNSAQAQRAVDEFRQDKGGDAAQIAAKASRDAWVTDVAQKAAEQQRYDAMRAAYTGSYAGGSGEQGEANQLWASLLGSGLDAGSEVISAEIKGNKAIKAAEA